MKEELKMFKYFVTSLDMLFINRVTGLQACAATAVTADVMIHCCTGGSICLWIAFVAASPYLPFASF